MSAMFRRPERESSSEAVAALIANLESNAEELKTVSHRAFREYIRDRGRSQVEAWRPIRAAALKNGGR